MSDGRGRPPRRVYALLAVMVLVWSVNFVVAKVTLREFPPLLLGALRFTVAGLVIAPVYVWRTMTEAHQAVERGAAARLLGIGLIGVGLNQLMFLLGLVRTSVAHASILICITPVFVLLLSAAAQHERITGKKLAALALAVSGILVLQGRSLFGSPGSVLGDLFVVLAALTFAFFTVAGKSVRSEFDSLTIITFAYTGSAVLLSPVTVWLSMEFDYSRVSVWGWVAVLYMAIFPSLVAYMIYYHALRYLAASRIAMLGYLQPLLATSLAVAFIGERVTPSLVVGGLLVVAGVVWAERS